MKNELVINILNYIDNCIYSKISIDELSNILNFNKDYIMRVFKKEINMTIIEYINKRRIYNSLESLQSTNNLILNIAINHGFVSQEYYTEIFIKYIGVNPITYRKFIKRDINIKEEEISTIRKNITDIKYSLDNIDNYKKIIKEEKVIKLSIFK